LIDEVLIGREEDLKPGFLGRTEQFAIQERAPPLLTRGFDDMPLEGVPNANRCSLIK